MGFRVEFGCLYWGVWGRESRSGLLRAYLRNMPAANREATEANLEPFRPWQRADLAANSVDPARRGPSVAWRALPPPPPFSPSPTPGWVLK